MIILTVTFNEWEVDYEFSSDDTTEVSEFIDDAKKIGIWCRINDCPVYILPQAIEEIRITES